MLQSIIRKYAGILTTLAVLSAAIASPFLIPENPDSPVFRSGTFALLLLIAAAFPVYQAFRNHSLRSLVYGIAFSLVFCICLGVGNEFRYYDQLLPGFGSLIRRFAVPVLAAPLVGCLFSFVFSYSPQQKNIKLRIPYAAYFLLFATCYTLVMLAFYPGVVNYDFIHEYTQYTTGIYQAAHPVFHTLFLGLVYDLGLALFGTLTEAAAFYSTIQLLLLAAMFAYACVYIQQRIDHPLIILLLSAGFAFLPFHGVLAVSTTKDPLFTGLCMLLCLWLWEITSDPDAFLNNRIHILRMCICCLLMSLLRHNGLFAFIPGCLAIVLLCRNKKGKAILICTGIIALSMIVPRGLETLMHAQKTPSSEMMSVPCQQLLRTAARADIPENERFEIGAWFSQAMHRYNPHCADAAKGGNFDFARFQADPKSYWSMYLHYAKEQPRVYIEAFLENCVALWNPDDTSHTEALAGEEYDHVYLLTAYVYEDLFDIHPQSKLPRLRKFLYDSTHHADHQNTLLLAQLFCPAIYSHLLLLTTLLAFYRRERRLALCTLPMWGIFFSLLFAAGIFIRYAYPLMTTVPLLFALIVFGKRHA